MAARRPGLPSPRPAEPAREPFVWVGGGLWACRSCGAGVPADFRDLHARWHGEEPAPRLAAKPVHGLAVPADERAPRLYFEVDTGLGPDQVLTTLRRWASGARADLSFSEPTGFRATFSGWDTVPGRPGVRLGVAVERTGAGTRVRCLFVPNNFQASDPSLYSTPQEFAGAQQARFDDLAGQLRAQIERR